LSDEAYRDLILRTDIGLFLYDRHRYRYRCSAVLQEMLTAGKPVIVPAGSWLADQLTQPIHDHLDQLRQSVSVRQTLHGAELPWQQAGRGGLRTEITVPDGATEVLIACQQSSADDAGSYLRVQSEQYDSGSNQLKTAETIVGATSSSGDVLTLHRVGRNASRVVLCVSNAYDEQQDLALQDVRVQFLDTRTTGAPPIGSVGLVATDHGQIPELLGEMLAHYEHFCNTAEAFADHWRTAHHPSQTVAVLTGGQPAQPATWATGTASVGR